jgi:hypothetical protein
MPWDRGEPSPRLAALLETGALGALPITQVIQTQGNDRSLL